MGCATGGLVAHPSQCPPLLSRHRDMDRLFGRDEVIHFLGRLGNRELHTSNAARESVARRSVIG